MICILCLSFWSGRRQILSWMDAGWILSFTANLRLITCTDLSWHGYSASLYCGGYNISAGELLKSSRFERCSMDPLAFQVSKPTKTAPFNTFQRQIDCSDLFRQQNIHPLLHALINSTRHYFLQ